MTKLTDEQAEYLGIEPSGPARALPLLKTNCYTRHADAMVFNNLFHFCRKTVTQAEHPGLSANLCGAGAGDEVYGCVDNSMIEQLRSVDRGTPVETNRTIVGEFSGCHDVVNGMKLRSIGVRPIICGLLSRRIIGDGHRSGG